MNRTLLEKVRYLLSNAWLDKSFWAEAIVYASHLLNRLLTTAIGGKTQLLVRWSYFDHSSLRVFGCPAYVDVNKDMLDSKVNKLMFLGYKENLKGYKLRDPKNKEFVSSRHVGLDEPSMMKPTIYQQVETMKTKLVLLQRVESNATPRCPIGSVSSEILSIVTQDEDRVVDMDTEDVEKVNSVAVRGTKGNSRKWVVKKHGSQVVEIHMTQPIGFVAAKKKIG